MNLAHFPVKKKLRSTSHREKESVSVSPCEIKREMSQLCHVVKNMLKVGPPVSLKGKICFHVPRHSRHAQAIAVVFPSGQPPISTAPDPLTGSQEVLQILHEIDNTSGFFYENNIASDSNYAYTLALLTVTTIDPGGCRGMRIRAPQPDLGETGRGLRQDLIPIPPSLAMHDTTCAKCAADCNGLFARIHATESIHAW